MIANNSVGSKKRNPQHVIEIEPAEKIKKFRPDMLSISEEMLEMKKKEHQIKMKINEIKLETEKIKLQVAKEELKNATKLAPSLSDSFTTFYGAHNSLC